MTKSTKVRLNKEIITGRLIDTTIEMMTVESIATVSALRIAERADVDKMTIRTYYGSYEGLQIAVAQTLALDFLPYLKKGAFDPSIKEDPRCLLFGKLALHLVTSYEDAFETILPSDLPVIKMMEEELQKRYNFKPEVSKIVAKRSVLNYLAFLVEPSFLALTKKQAKVWATIQHETYLALAKSQHKFA